MKLKTKFEFDAAHRLVGYEGKCLNLHGHRWVVEIEIEGEGVGNVGIMWDFTNVKEIEKMFDHKTILKDCKENEKLIEAIIDSMRGTTDYKNSVYKMKENPTAEMLCKEILGYLQEENNLKFKVRVWESPKSWCEIEG